MPRKMGNENYIGINIEPEFKKTLRKIAEEEDRTISSLIKAVLRNYVKQRALSKDSLKTTA